MPTVLRTGPYRFYFYSHEPNEPAHVHVDRENLSATFWLSTGELASNRGYRAHELRKIARILAEHQADSWRPGMSISRVRTDDRVADVKFTKNELSVRLVDGRTITVPLEWYPRLLNATRAQRNNWRIAGAGYGIHWPELDEDLSTEGLLRGAPAPGVRKKTPEAARTRRS